MQPANERHVTSTDRAKAGSIPEVRGQRPRNKPGATVVDAERMPRQTFEEAVLPHLDAAFNYARWLTRSGADAEDVVQDAYVRALRFFPSLRNDDARSWLLTIVRNTWYGRFPRAKGATQTTVYDDMTHEQPDEGPDPEALVIQQQAIERVRRAVQELPADFREVIVLRELEGLSYKEIAAVARIPIGTVMSRLARARERLLTILGPSVAPTREQS
jgi:RNA polymerase sigma factor (sigma-70 family)